MKTHPPRRIGLSLLELLAVMVILSVVSALVIPRIGHNTNRTKRESCATYKADINAVVERFVFDHGTIPTMADIQNPPYYSQPIPKCPVDGQAYTLDPKTGRLAGHDH